jgi:hypothetical protein
VSLQTQVASGFARLVTAINNLKAQVFAPDIRKLTATQASSSIVLANITGLASALVANGVYRVTAFITFQSAATTTGLNLGYTAPAGSVVQLDVSVPIANTAANTHLRKQFPNAAESVSGSVLGTGVTAINNNHTAKVEGLIFVGTNPGNFQLQFASEVALSAVTLQVGSSLVIQRVA